MVDDDVTLQYDVIDGLAGPDELGRTATHTSRLHTARTHTSPPVPPPDSHITTTHSTHSFITHMRTQKQRFVHLAFFFEIIPGLACCIQSQQGSTRHQTSPPVPPPGKLNETYRLMSDWHRHWVNSMKRRLVFDSTPAALCET